MLAEAKELDLTPKEMRKKYKIGYILYKRTCDETGIKLRSSHTIADHGRIKEIMWEAHEKGWSAIHASRVHKVKAQSIYCAAYKCGINLRHHRDFVYSQPYGTTIKA